MPPLHSRSTCLVQNTLKLSCIQNILFNILLQEALYSHPLMEQSSLQAKPSKQIHSPFSQYPLLQSLSIEHVNTKISKIYTYTTCIIFHSLKSLPLHSHSLQKRLFISTPQQSPPSNSHPSLLFRSSQNPSPIHSGFPTYPANVEKIPSMLWFGRFDCTGP